MTTDEAKQRLREAFPPGSIVGPGFDHLTPEVRVVFGVPEDYRLDNNFRYYWRVLGWALYRNVDAFRYAETL